MHSITCDALKTLDILQRSVFLQAKRKAPAETAGALVEIVAEHGAEPVSACIA